MRKLLLGTTAVAAAALFGAQDASAQSAPTVRIGGYFEFSGAYVSDNIDGSTTERPSGRSKYDFRSDFEIIVTVAGKAANGLIYGATIELQGDNQSPVGAASSGSAIVDTDEAWLFVQSPTLGTIQAGDQDSAGNQLAVGPGNFVSGGVGGIFDDFLAGQPSIVTNINDGNDATKIIYLSPQFFGFDVGFSYAPNSGEGERQQFPASATAVAVGSNPTGQFQRDRSGLQNEYSYGARYRGTFGGVGLSASFSGMHASPATYTSAGTTITNTDAISAYTAGIGVTIGGLLMGADYTWGNYSGSSAGRAPLRTGRDQSTAISLGALYTIGALRLGGFYGVGNQDNGPGVVDRNQEVYGIGGDYTIAPGLQAFSYLSRLSDKGSVDSVGNPLNGASRRADTFIVGTRLAF